MNSDVHMDKKSSKQTAFWMVLRQKNDTCVKVTLCILILKRQAIYPLIQEVFKANFRVSMDTGSLVIPFSFDKQQMLLGREKR